MSVASAPSFLASLREYFHQRRTYVRRRRVGRSHAMRHHASASRFTLELLEDRVLLSATPTEVVAPEVATVQQSAEQAIVSPQDVSLELAVAPTSSGQLVITEIMANPNFVADNLGEWFEVYNPTTTTLDLQGLTLLDNGITDHHTISQSVLVAPGGFAVLGNNDNFSTNGGVTVNYKYTGFAIANTVDAIRIFNGTTLIDEVSYSNVGGWPIVAGRSMVLNPDPITFDDVDNNSPSSWSQATTPYNPMDFGNPGTGAPPSIVTIDNVILTEGNSGTTNATFTVTLSRPVPQNVTVDYATANGTAGAGSDYVATSGTLTFAVGEISKFITVAVIGDAIAELNESFVVNLSNAVGATLSDGTQGQATITNDDTASTPVASGQLVITEIMANPRLVADNLGEWFEVYNPTSTTWDLQGLTVRDNNFDQFTISQSVFVTPGGFAVLGNNSNFSTNGGVVVNYAYPTSFIIANATDQIRILNGTTPIDEVSYSVPLGWPAGIDGRSMVLNPNPATFDSASNDVFTNWSQATTPYNSMDFGNPGSGAPPVVITISDVTLPAEGNTGSTNATFTLTLSHPTTQSVSVNYATANGTATSGNDYVTKSGTLVFAAGETTAQLTVLVSADIARESTENFFLNLSSAVNATIGDAQGEVTIIDDDTPGPGQLIITEIMADSAVSEPAGEWFELYNPTARAWDLQGLLFKDDGTDQFTVSSSLVIQPGGFLVLGSNGNPGFNGGVLVDYVYGTAFALANAGDEIELFSQGPLISIDRVAYAPGVFPLVAGHSLVLNPISFDAVSNDLGSNWSEAQTPLPGAGFGSPGTGLLPVLSINDVTVLEGDNGTTNAVFTVTLPGGPVGQAVTVDYTTADVTAVAGSDYAAASGQLTFQVGETSRPITVVVNGDMTVEPIEKFQVVLSNPINAILGDFVGQGTIAGDPTDRGFTVNSVGDESDTNPGDGVAVTVVGTVTLRAAIEEANALFGIDRIQFAIGTGPQTIALQTAALPALTDTVLIEGNTQPDYSGTPLIEITQIEISPGVILADVDGFEIQNAASDTVIRGLTINQFTGNGIVIDGARGVVIQGDIIGTDASSAVDLGNGKEGILIVNGQNNVIGGTSAPDRNVISGNAGDGINVTGMNASGNMIQGNYVGTDLTGTVAIPNGGNGISLNQGVHANTVGGGTSGAGNIVAGNGASGIVLDGQLTNLAIDLVPGAGISDPSNLTVFKNALYFSADDGIAGRELWRYDGAGASLIKDIFSGINSSSPTALTVFDGLLYFGATDSTGSGLWVTDGTLNGTHKVLTTPLSPGNMAVFNGALYFSVPDSSGWTLWRYDGISPTPLRVFDTPNNASSTGFTVYNGHLYFVANDGLNGRELWRTDGTAGGTILITGFNGSSSSFDTSDLCVYDGKLYFRANVFPVGIGFELYRVDTISGGPLIELVADVNPGSGSSAIGELTVYNNVLYFKGNTGAGTKLLRYDGTTVSLAANVATPQELTVFNGYLYFTANNFGRDLWRYDGTTASRLTEFHTGGGFGPTGLTQYNDALFFNLGELWSFGQTASIRSVDITPGAASSLPSNLTPFSNAMYFSVGGGIGGLWESLGSATAAVQLHSVTPRDMGVFNGNLYLNELNASGVELWQLEPGGVTPVAVKDINPTGDANPTDFTVYGSYLYFAADGGDVAGGRELWRTDGTAAGTIRVADINLTGSSNPSSLQVFNGKLYFSAMDGINGAGLWSYDGTTATLVAGNQASAPTNLTVFNGSLYFVTGLWAWKYDGTTVSQIPNLQKPRDLEVFNGALYFWALATDGRRGLWRYDGTTVSLVAPDLDVTGTLTVFNNALYFSANGDDGAGTELWRYDGVGATRLTDVNPGAGNFDPQELSVLGSTLFFTGDNGLSGRELYWFEGETTGNAILGNKIGTNVSGMGALGNQGEGITIIGAPGNLVGGAGAGEGNVISGNLRNGILINGLKTTANIIQGNLIGIDALGSVDLGNAFDGIHIDSAANTQIGGTLSAQRNVISGNDGDGVELSGATVRGTVIQGNYIGSDLAGTSAIANSSSGVVLGDAIRTATVGGTVSGAGNLISGNSGDGVTIIGKVTSGLIDINQRTGSLGFANHGDSSPTDFTVFNDKLYFSAEDGINGRPLMSYDGTKLSLIYKNTNGVAFNPTDLTVFGNYLYFAATSPSGVGLWRTDGGLTAVSTQSVPGISNPSGLTVFQDALYFNASGGVGGVELWRYDGQGSPTPVADINPGPPNANPTDFKVYGDHLYFVADGGGGKGRELWRTDGTSTERVTDINPNGSADPSSLQVYDGRLYFSATDGATGFELWSFDGTGATRVSDLNPGIGSASPEKLTVFKNVLYFSANDGTSITGFKLWRYDGSTVSLAADLSPSELIAFNGQLYFNSVLSDGTVGGLWRYDGTTATRVADFFISGPAVFDNTMYFQSSDPLHGSELWWYGSTTKNNLIQGNRIGTNAAGTGVLGNGASGVSIDESPSNIVGGTTAAARNVISGNLTGVTIDGTVTAATQIVGNYIGTNVNGSAPVPNSAGIVVHTFGTAIGGTTSGTGNLISGNTTYGVFVDGLAAQETRIQGNIIGADATGTLAVGNGTGVAMVGAVDTLIGGEVSGAGNIISGNVGDGIALNGNARRTFIQGNIIGANVAGTVAVGNNGDGIDLANAAVNLIGGDTALTRNVISGNGQNGILVSGTAATTYGNAIVGNYIGTTAAGTGDLGNAMDGIAVTGGISTVVGGLAFSQRNVISGNNGAGIRLGSTATVVEGNIIGADASGSLALGNSGDGVTITGNQNTVGGTPSGAGNLMAFNGGTGVTVIGGAAIDNAILGNAIYGNLNTATLGIDLGGNGITPNDPQDVDGSPNHFQNYPVLSGAFVGSLVVQDGTIAPVSVGVRGTLNSTPSTLTTRQSFTLEFFASPASGGPQRFLGRSAVVTDTAGNASFDFVFPSPVSLGELVTATATDAQGNTSEFSAAIPVTNAGVATAELTVRVDGNGTVTSLPIGLNAPTVSHVTYPAGTLVRLTATPDAGYTFVRWTGQGIDSTSPTLDLRTTTAGQSITATFVPTGSTDSEAPIVTYTDATPFWSDGVTFTWSPAIVPGDRELLGYLVRVTAVEPGFYPTDPVFPTDPIFPTDPVFVRPTETSLTLLHLPPVRHYFTVSTLTRIMTLQGAEMAPLLEPATATGLMPDIYATSKGVTFSTVKETGVLANDQSLNGNELKARLVSGPNGTTQGSLQTFNANGSFVFVPLPTFVGTATFTYEVSDDNGANYSSGPILVSIIIAQESGQSVESSATTDPALQAWTIVQDSSENAPANWSGALNPVLSQYSSIGESGLVRAGTHLFLTSGLAEGRTDYTITLTVQSDAVGAVGIMFRYQDGSHYYRFSMERDPNGDGNTSDGYRRLIKMNGSATVLMEQSPTNPGLPAGTWQLLTGPAYTPGVKYPLIISAAGDTFTVTLRDPSNGQALLNWTVTDPTPFTSSGLALYSADNPGGYFNVLSVEGLSSPDPNSRSLAVWPDFRGLGLGTVTSTWNGNQAGVVFPGSPAAMFPQNTPQNPSIVTLTATAAPGSTFGGWFDAQGNSLGTATTLNVTMDVAKVMTARFNGPATPAYMLDVNADGVATPQDAIVILRYLSLVTGPALTAGVVTGGQRTDPVAIKAYLDGARATMLDVNQDGQATPQDAIVILRHLSLVSGPALTAGVITGGAQTDPAIIKNYLNRYTPGATFSSASNELSALSSELSDSSAGNAQLSLASAPSAASTDESAVSAPSGSAPSAQPAPLSSSEVVDNTALASPLTVSLSPESENAAIAVTQLNYQSVLPSPWVNQFVGTASMEEDEEFVVAI
jgi:ELWxxDGT repeat protein